MEILAFRALFSWFRGDDEHNCWMCVAGFGDFFLGLLERFVICTIELGSI